MNFWQKFTLLQQLLILLVTGIVVLLAVNIGILIPISAITGAITAPLLGASSSISATAHAMQETLLHLGELREENVLLRAENKRLIAQHTTLREVEEENERLRQLLKLKEKADYNLLHAEIIGKEPTNFLKILILNRGTKDGVREGQAVITTAKVDEIIPIGIQEEVVPILVGQVIAANTYQARVLIITDKDSVVPAKIQTSRTDGIVRGMGVGPGLVMDYIQQDDFFKINDVVITSGLQESSENDDSTTIASQNSDDEQSEGLEQDAQPTSFLFPKGLYIGSIYNKEADPTAVSQKAYIHPLINFNQLETVAIILQ